MLSIRTYVVLTLSGLFALIEFQVQCSEWKYPESSENEDFPKWGGLCDTGERQSPINLRVRDAVKGVFAQPLQLANINDTIKEVSLVNNGHTVKMFNFGHNILLSGGPLTGSYKLEQIHFHWWSEHTIDSIRFPFEMHMVFRNVRYVNATMAAQQSDGLAVVGILFHASFERDPFIDNIMTKLHLIKSYEKANQIEQVKILFSIQNIVPSLDEYFTYNGSLTTPGCGEAVTWIIISQIMPITTDQVNAFRALEYESGKRLKNNYRTTQSTNDRAVVRITNKGSLISMQDDVIRNSSCHLHISLWCLATTLCFILKYFL